MCLAVCQVITWNTARHIKFSHLQSYSSATISMHPTFVCKMIGICNGPHFADSHIKMNKLDKEDAFMS